MSNSTQKAIQVGNTLLCYYRNENTHSNISVAEYISKEIIANNPMAKILYIDTQKQHNGKYNTTYTSTPMIEIDYLIGQDGTTNEQALEIFKQSVKEYDHVIIDNLEALIFMYVNDSKEKIRFKKTAFVGLFDKFKFNDSIDITVSILSDKIYDKELFASIEQKHNHRLFIDLTLDNNNVQLIEKIEDEKEDALSGFFDEVENTERPQTGVYRMDYILKNNRAQYGDMIFFSAQDNQQLTEYTLDTLIANAPIHTSLLFISPFRAQREVKKTLQLLNKIAPLSLKALQRTTFVSSEDFRGVELDDANALMQTIREKINAFRSTLDNRGEKHGICLINSLRMDGYGAELDYPSLRWYAKSNDILIIIGADDTEERYTFARREIENIIKNKQISKANPLALPEKKL